MPSDKFYKLDESKRTQIIESAKREFSMNRYEESSINKIIKDINMPRGSFYLYFDDKQDLYLYVLKMYIDTFKTRFIEILNNNKNDLFISLLIYYEEITNTLIEKKELVKNIFMNMNSKQLDVALPEFLKEEIDGSIIENIDISNYELKEEEKKILLSIVLPIFFHATALTLDNIQNKDFIKEHYIKQLNIIKRGLERK